MGRRNLKCDECGTPMIWLGKNEWDEDEWECPNCADQAEWEDDDIPEGCVACGGPYPDCISSCEMFDD